MLKYMAPTDHSAISHYLLLNIYIPFLCQIIQYPKILQKLF